MLDIYILIVIIAIMLITLMYISLWLLLKEFKGINLPFIDNLYEK